MIGDIKGSSPSGEAPRHGQRVGLPGTWRISEAMGQPPLTGEELRPLETRFNALDYQTVELTARLLIRYGGRTAARFVATHEHLNRLFESAMDYDLEAQQDLGGLVDVVYETVATLSDGLTQGNVREAANRQEDVATQAKEELPAAVHNVIAKCSGSVGQRDRMRPQDTSLI